jgi:hypothetical protein
MANSLSCLHNHHDKLDSINPCKLRDVHFLSALLLACSTSEKLDCFCYGVII